MIHKIGPHPPFVIRILKFDILGRWDSKEYATYFRDTTLDRGRS